MTGSSGAANAGALGSFRAEGREVVVERLLAAPPELVFAAWTEPARIAAWWGPRGFCNDVQRLDPRPGGLWRIVQTDPQGGLHPFHGEYLEVVPPGRLVFTQRYEAAPHAGENWLVTCTFAAEDGMTRVHIVTTMPNDEALQGSMALGMKRGMDDSLDRLAEQLTQLLSGAEALGELGLVAVRLVGQPQGEVFAMWTDPRRFERWWGPQGFLTTVEAMEVRPGGALRFVMQGPDGRRYPNEISYVLVDPPHRIVLEHRAPPPWFRHEVTLRGQGSQTEVTVRIQFASTAGREQAIREYGAAEGLQQTFDRLVAVLA
jgi:uncharacterized protein YndB with AHSA1/START domain